MCSVIYSLGVWGIVGLTIFSISGYFAGPQITDGLQQDIDKKQALEDMTSLEGKTSYGSSMSSHSDHGIKNSMECMNMYDSDTQLPSPEIFSLENVDTAKLDRCVRYFHQQGMIENYDRETWQKYYDILNGN